MSQRRLAPLLILLVALLGHGLLLLSLHTRTLNPLFNDTWNRPGPGADFFAVYHAGRQVLGGRDPYSDAGDGVTPVFAPFRYLPGVAWGLGAPLARLRPWFARGLWIVILEVTLAFDLLVVGRLFVDWRWRAGVSMAWLLFLPLYVELWMGQFTFFVASLAFFASWAWRQGAGRPAAALWSVAAAIKLFPLALVPALWRDRRWLALVAGAAMIVGAALPLVFDPAAATLFVRLNFSEIDFESFHAGNFGLQAFLYRTAALCDQPTPAAWHVVSVVLSVLLAGAATLAMLRRGSDGRLAFAFMGILLPLISKHVWEHHYVALLPALTWLVHLARERGARGDLLMLAAVYLVVCLPSPIALLQTGPPVWHPEREWAPWVRAVYHAPRPLAALVLFGHCIRQSWSPPAPLERAA